ncbi:MAG: phosphodiester glycosidase family protein [Methanocella sp.]
MVISYVVLFAAVTGPLLLLWGPFPHLRRAAAESALTSMHRRLAALFVSRAELAALERGKFEGYGGFAFRPLRFQERHDDRLEMFEVRSPRFHGYVLLVHDPRRLAVAFSQSLPRAGETTSALARRTGAVAAVNAGGFGDNHGAGTGGLPEGIILHEGRFVFSEKSANRGEVRVIGFDRQGALVVGELTKAEMVRRGLREAVAFGPPLVLEGQPLISKGDGGWGIAPRTAIGQRRDGTVILLVIDGRQVTSLGATLRDVQNVMLSYGAYVAANLDGGSSATMYYHGRVINHPSDPMGERMVPTAFVVKP